MVAELSTSGVVGGSGVNLERVRSVYIDIPSIWQNAKLKKERGAKMTEQKRSLENMKRALATEDCSYRKLAEYLGVNLTTVNSKLNGATEFTAEQYLAIKHGILRGKYDDSYLMNRD